MKLFNANKEVKLLCQKPKVVGARLFGGYKVVAIVEGPLALLLLEGDFRCFLGACLGEN